MKQVYETVIVEKDGGIATVTLNRPEKKNSLHPTMHREMCDILPQLAHDDEVRVLVITGAGDAFAAGNDLQAYFLEFENDPVGYWKAHYQASQWRGPLLRYFPKPTIAAVNGWCLGGAMPIVESCDIVIAAEEAMFGMPEINFRLFPGGPVTKSVTEMMNLRQGIFYSMTGRSFDGKKAVELGVATLAVPRSELWNEVRTIAGELMAKDPVGLRMAKETYRWTLEMGYPAAEMLTEVKQQQASYLQGDAWKKEAIPDFLSGKFRPGKEAHKRS